MTHRILLIIAISLLSTSPAALGQYGRKKSQSGSSSAPAIEIKPLKTGDKVPDLTLRNAAGDPVEIKKLLAEKPAVFVFYRGSWCPYCNRHLAALKSIDPKLHEMGFLILAVSPDQPEKIADHVAKQDLTYALLSDSKMDAAKAFGLSFKIENLSGANAKRLEDASGESHHMLPAPGVFIVDQQGVVRFAHANVDYKVRLEPAKIIAAAAKVKADASKAGSDAAKSPKKQKSSTGK